MLTNERVNVNCTFAPLANVLGHVVSAARAISTAIVYKANESIEWSLGPARDNHINQHASARGSLRKRMASCETIVRTRWDDQWSIDKSWRHTCRRHTTSCQMAKFPMTGQFVSPFDQNDQKMTIGALRFVSFIYFSHIYIYENVFKYSFVNSNPFTGMPERVTKLTDTRLTWMTLYGHNHTPSPKFKLQSSSF